MYPSDELYMNVKKGCIKANMAINDDQAKQKALSQSQDATVLVPLADPVEGDASGL